MEPVRGIIECFSALKDPRQANKVLYPLPEILLLLLAATLAGADDFVEICVWGKQNIEVLRRFFPYKNGIPSHDALGALLAALDPATFRTCFTTWVESLRAEYAAPPERDLVAIDGKTSRRTHNRKQGCEPLHLLSAWASRQRLVIGQQATAAKANEATTIPLLLERLALQGALVTIDAGGATTRIAQTVLDRGADYLLALKANRPALFEATEALFADPDLDLPTAVTDETSHGRHEHRRHVVCYDVAWINPTRSETDSIRFPGVAMVGMVERTITRNGQTNCERHYYVASTRLDPVTFGRAVRAHWSIENNLHWTLDVVFHDDLARLRTDNAPENMAIVRHIALNCLHATKPITSFKNRRKLAGWSTDYLEKVMKGHA
ncbi:MAG TPA: ISAs1 family transposase [Acetobacteraceae bacterium]|nr:ISAs1 family transposase [Acetobacteraceae bacterium]